MLFRGWVTGSCAAVAHRSKTGTRQSYQRSLGKDCRNHLPPMSGYPGGRRGTDRLHVPKVQELGCRCEDRTLPYEAPEKSPSANHMASRLQCIEYVIDARRSCARQQQGDLKYQRRKKRRATEVLSRWLTNGTVPQKNRRASRVPTRSCFTLSYCSAASG